VCRAERSWAKGAKLTAIALNDYKTDFLAADAQDTDAIVLRVMNGALMRTRNKVQLSIVYPCDSSSALRSQI